MLQTISSFEDSRKKGMMYFEGLLCNVFGSIRLGYYIKLLDFSMYASQGWNTRKQFNTSRSIELNLDSFLNVLSVFTSGNSLIGATFNVILKSLTNVDRFNEHKILKEMGHIKQIFGSSTKDVSISGQDLKFDPENDVYFLDAFPDNIGVDSYISTFESALHNAEGENMYATRGRVEVPIYTGFSEVIDVIFYIDLGSVEAQKSLSWAEKNNVHLSENQLQKLRLLFQLSHARFSLMLRPSSSYVGGIDVTMKLLEELMKNKLV
ncbi:hypothetical protein RDI58_004148 [Solanum bulbocastanum]|uniref:Uncharacterized protein n=1 Tax=Solanum bulbocastanum TaxID=147425 RepID=A0AAN8U610_SOLBU